MSEKISLQQLKEWVRFDTNTYTTTFNLDAFNAKSLCLYYYDDEKKLTELPSAKYSINLNSKKITLLDKTLAVPQKMLLTYKTNKELSNILYDFSFPDFSFLKNLVIPTYTSSWLSSEQLVPKYQTIPINTLTLYPSDIYDISQDNSLLIGAENEPYANIVNNPRYSDFFTWYSNNLIDINNFKIYYSNLITSLNTFITNNTIDGLLKPTLGDASTLSTLLMSKDYDVYLENDVKTLYQYQIDYYNTLNHDIVNYYSNLSNNISRVFYYDPIFSDNTTPLNIVIKRDGYTPTLVDILSSEYSFGLNAEGVNYDLPNSSFINNETNYAKWKYWFDNGKADEFLFYNLQQNTPLDLAVKQEIPIYIQDNQLNTPPATFQNFTLYVVGTASIGDWAGHSNEYAYNDGTKWFFLTPAQNDKICVVAGVDLGSYYEYSGSNWTSITYVVGDNNNIAKGVEFNNNAIFAAEYYEPYIDSLNAIFDDYTSYISSTLPISLLDAIYDLQRQNTASFAIVNSMINSVVAFRTQTTAMSWDQFKSSIIIPFVLQYNYLVTKALNPYYFKDDINKISLLDNTGLFFGDYYDIATNSSKFLVGANQEKYDNFINLPEYNGFKNYLSTLTNYIDSISITLNSNLESIQEYCLKQDIEFDKKYYFNLLVYNQYNIDNCVAEVKNIVNNTELTKNTDNVTDKQINDDLSDNINGIYKKTLLSLKVHPFFQNQIDLTIPTPPDDFLLDYYTLIVRYDDDRQKWVLDYGVAVDNTSDVNSNNKIIAISQMTTLEELRNFFDVPTKDYIVNNFQYFGIGEISTFVNPPSANWFLCDGSVIDKRTFHVFYDNFINKIQVKATQGSNQYEVISMNKKYKINSGIIIISPDNLFSFGKIQSYNNSTNILTINKISNKTGTFYLEHIDFFGSHISDINQNQIILPNITGDMIIGCEMDNGEIGYSFNENYTSLDSSQMPQINIQYQNDIFGRSQIFATLAASFISLPYINVSREKITKVSQTKIDTRQKSCAVGKFYIRLL